MAAVEKHFCNSDKSAAQQTRYFIDDIMYHMEQRRLHVL